MKVLVTFALQNEFAPWRKLRAFRQIDFGPHPVFEGCVNSADVRVLLTGVGCRGANRARNKAFEWEPDVCISSGFAGGLRPEYKRGMVLAATKVIDDIARTDTYESDAFLLECAGKKGARRVGAFYTSEVLATTAQEKRRWATVADAVDMESSKIMGDADTLLIPAVAIRAISDTSEEDLPLDFGSALDGDGKIMNSRIAWVVLKAPRHFPRIVRLAKTSRRVAEVLVQFLDELIESWSVLPNDKGHVLSTAVDP